MDENFGYKLVGNWRTASKNVVVRMRNNFLQSDWISQDLDSSHSLPICQMGNYQEYLKKQTPQLREIESTPVRQHMFGNPFKIDKRMMVDEADIDFVGSPSGTSRNNKRPNTNTELGSRLPLKRKPGPLPKNFSIRRPSSSDSLASGSLPGSPQPSPVPWLNAVDRELRFDESPSVLANGLDSSLVNERSRSPSPTFEPTFEVNYSTAVSPSPLTPPALNKNAFSYSTAGQSDSLPMASFNEFYTISSIETTNKEISQILKETNYNHNSLESINNLDEKKEKKSKSKVLNNISKEEIDKQNFEIRKKLNSLVRKPGKNYTELFKVLKTLKGDIDAQVQIVKLIIKECLKFKRQSLANLLEDHINSLLSLDVK